MWRHLFCDVIRSKLRHPSTRPSSWARCSWPWAPGRAAWRRRAASPANNVHSVKNKKLHVNLSKTHCKVIEGNSFSVFVNNILSEHRTWCIFEGEENTFHETNCAIVIVKLLSHFVPKKGIAWRNVASSYIKTAMVPTVSFIRQKAENW